MNSRRTRRIGLIATIVLGRIPVRRRIVGRLVRGSSRVAKAVFVGRILRRALGVPAPKSVVVRSSRALIDVDPR